MVDKKSQGHQAISKDLKLKIEKGLALQKVFDKLEAALCLTIIEAAYNMKIKRKKKGMTTDKKLKGFNLLAYMYVRTDAKSWADALAYTPNRKQVMLDLRNQLVALDKLIPSNDEGFLKYLDDVVNKEDLLNKDLKHLKILGDDTNLRESD